MIRELRALIGGSRLELDVPQRGVETDPGAQELDTLVGAFVYQAMHDGMLRVWIGVDRASGEPFLKYFGPLGYDPKNQIWWDMVPPPSECYPGMLQVCLTLAELDQGFPIKGMIPAIKQGKRLRLELEVNEIDSFQIAWDESYADNRDTAGTSYPEEGQAGDRRSDGDAAQPA